MSASLPVLADAADTIGGAMSDTMITAKVKSSLAANSVTSAANISVQTNKGVVSLSGKAGSNTEAVTAVEIAESTKDVKDVEAFNLKVANSGQPLKDAYITAKVRGLMIKNNLKDDKKDVSNEGVKVETHEGVVYFSGSVNEASEIDALQKIAKSIDDVKDVKSTLKVK